MIAFPDSFRKSLEEAIGRDAADVAFSSFGAPASVSVRFNPLKGTGMVENPDVHFSCRTSPVPWSPHGRILSDRPDFTLDPLLHAGAYYVQDSSSMFVGEVFRSVLGNLRERKKGQIRVLDLCAAPGGKSTDILASLREVCGDDFLLVSNEVMSARVSVLADNIALWGDPNIVVTNADPASFSFLEGFFDVIVADVPCSGEGMFRKDPRAASQWSPDAVSLCQARQRRIVADVWPALSREGVFIYSTCTFNNQENDDNVMWIAENLGAVPASAQLSFEGVMKTRTGFLLVPGFVPGEGQFCAALVRNDEGNVSGFCKRPGRNDRKHPGRNDCRQIPERMLRDSTASLFRIPVRVVAKGDAFVAIPEIVADAAGTISSAVRTIRSGCMAGTVKGNILVPDADLALSSSLSADAFPRADLDRTGALAFLHRDNIVLENAPKGYVLVCYGGLPLGFVKNLGGRCNNLHPQGRRIRMEIK